MRYLLLLLFSLVVLTAANCKKNVSLLTIKGFLLTDEMGNVRGQYGDANGDWQFVDNLSDREMALFNFDNDKLDNTVETTVQPVKAYPNPVSQFQSYAAYAQDSVLLKLVIADAALNVFSKSSVKMKGAISYSIDLHDRTKFKNTSALRVYYSFSAKDKPNFKVGLGDIYICDEAPADYMKCFR